MNIRWLSHLSLLTLIVAWIAMGLGAYTRLIDAGLSCPDWPGCYGHLTVPHSAQTIQEAEHRYPSTPVVQSKAWAEMIHRYIASTLGLLTAIVAFLAVRAAIHYSAHYWLLGAMLFFCVLAQGMLGLWTVTLQLLPLIVTLHLLGAMTLMALLWILHLKSRFTKILSHSPPPSRALSTAAFLGLLLVIAQIALGAWTSSHWAALSCPDFPRCQSLARFDIRYVFNLSPFPTELTQKTIQMAHRFGALIVVLYWLGFSLWILTQRTYPPPLKKILYVLLIVLLLQITLGTLNVIQQLPVIVAIAHNLVAALLLLSVIALIFFMLLQRKYHAHG